MTEKWVIHRGFADWGMGASHVITLEGEDPHNYEQVIAEIPFVQPYCLGSSLKEREASKKQFERARLIAEAPEMYRLLDLLRHYAAVQVKYHPDALDSPMWRDMLAVLKRIDGEKQ